MKRLYASNNTLLLEQLKAALEEAGIAVMLRNMNRTGQAAGELPPIVCWPEIWLRDEEQLVAARQILSEVLADIEQPGEAWACPQCGEQLEGQFGSCWRCAGDETSP